MQRAPEAVTCSKDGYVRCSYKVEYDGKGTNWVVCTRWEGGVPPAANNTQTHLGSSVDRSRSMDMDGTPLKMVMRSF
jgi:hypothetical protein